MTENPYTNRIKKTPPSEIRRLLKYADAPNWISFGGGFPDEYTFFMKDKMIDLMISIQKKYSAPKYIQYAASTGCKCMVDALREKYLPALNINVVEGGQDSIVIGAGAQQILAGFGKMYYGKKTIISESPTYVGALPAFSQNSLNVVGIKTDKDGMEPNALDGKISEIGADNVAFVYIIPNFQNPTGIQLIDERREKILDICMKNNIPIVEDDPYPLMYFPGKSCPQSIKSKEQERIKGTDRKALVSYVGTSSKTFGGGFRVGWMVGPNEVAQEQASLIGIECLFAPALSQFIIGEYLLKNGYDGLVRDTDEGRQRYYSKKTHMVKELKKEFGREVTFHEPDGGLFLWIRIPGIDTKKMLDFATGLHENPSKNAQKENSFDDYKIIFVPGEAFAPNNPKDFSEYMRITYANSDFEEITKGVFRLRKLVEYYKKHMVK
ncbi:MAG: PLP-dependent aminotransferase family protein [archaeon]